MPVEFLSDQEAAAFGRYGGSVPLADLERFFYLDDADRKLVAGQREDHNRLGFSVQLATVRYIGRFQADPLDGVPSEVIDFLAGQLQVADPSCVKRYAQRQQTHREHAAKIRETLGLNRAGPAGALGAYPADGVAKVTCPQRACSRAEAARSRRSAAQPIAYSSGPRRRGGRCGGCGGPSGAGPADA